MTDRELLELAAKAAGIEYAHIDGYGAILYSEAASPVNND